MDLLGPVSPPTWNGKKYVLTLLDDYSHFIVLYLLNSKAEAVSAIKEYIAEVETTNNAKVATVRMDNGLEFKNHNLIEWCKAKGIKMDWSATYSPQMNGKAERLNRSLLDKTRALLYDSKLEEEMWGEAMQTSAYLLNRIPSR